MCALVLSNATTRGLEMTLPRLSASSAESSRLIRLPLQRLISVSASWPAAPDTGRLTFSAPGSEYPGKPLGATVGDAISNGVGVVVARTSRSPAVLTAGVVDKLPVEPTE